MDRFGTFDVDWVFGYGSLIWNPEIDYEAATLARLHGWHRAFCVKSRHYRGTAERPGLVLGLDRGGSCTGIVYRLRRETRARAIRHLLAREIPDFDTPVYRPIIATLRYLDERGDVQSVQALTFAADRSRNTYARLSDEDIIERLRHCHGQRGPNREYALNTLRALEAHGVHDARLSRIVRRLLAEADARAAPASAASSVTAAATRDS